MDFYFIKCFNLDTVENAAKREVWEEAGIKVAGIEKVGHIDFEFAGDPDRKD